MKRAVLVGSILVILILLQTKAFAASSFSNLKCNILDGNVSGVGSIKVAEGYLVINQQLEIPLEESRIKCGTKGKKTRFDGNALGYQVILKSCSNEGKLQGHIIDSVKSKVASVVCK